MLIHTQFCNLKSSSISKKSVFLKIAAKAKSKLQKLQNKCICFCLNLDSETHIGLTEFEKINWLPINDRFEQCICSLTFKYFNYLSPLYMNDVFKLAGQNTTTTRTSLFKLSQPL